MFKDKDWKLLPLEQNMFEQSIFRNVPNNRARIPSNTRISGEVLMKHVFDQFNLVFAMLHFRHRRYPVVPSPMSRRRWWCETRADKAEEGPGATRLDASRRATPVGLTFVRLRDRRPPFAAMRAPSVHFRAIFPRPPASGDAHKQFGGWSLEPIPIRA